jgi:hypothetical protein
MQTDLVLHRIVARITEVRLAFARRDLSHERHSLAYLRNREIGSMELCEFALRHNLNPPSVADIHYTRV